MRFVLFMLFLCLSVLPQTARGENSQNASLVHAEFPKTLRHTGSARVDKVLDEKSILMTDGKIIRLLGIDFPFVDEGDDTIFVASKTRLEELLPKGTEVMLYQTRNKSTRRENRMGQTLAHVVIKKKSSDRSPPVSLARAGKPIRDQNQNLPPASGDNPNLPPASGDNPNLPPESGGDRGGEESREGTWVNGAIVRDGLAYAVTDTFNPDMAADLYALESLARKDAKGLWAKDSPHGLLTADSITDASGTFRVVEGVVNRAAMSRNELYLNFGADWKKDFTVKISPLLRRSFTKAGINPLDLSGKKVRVRGWLRDWNGPFMELETVERLEIVGP
jgi:endonuclease YncB( thermonuclease family)